MTVTIAIPTYNREHELKVLLDEILIQAQEVPSASFNVLVSDNASTDGTERMVESMRQRFAEFSIELVYVRNNSNLGFSRNVINAIENSSGEFVLIMGDDDSLELHTLGFLNDTIPIYTDADLFFLKPIEYSSDLYRRTTSLSVENSCETLVYDDGIKYIHLKKGYPPALISGYIVRKSAWLSCNARDFSYSMCVHMLVATRLLLRHAMAVEIMRPCIKYRGGQQNTTWSHDELYPFRFYLDLLMATKIMKSEMDSRTLKILEWLSLRTIAFYLLRQKVVEHPFSETKFRDYYRTALCRHSLYSFMIMMIQLTPGFLIRMFLGHWIRALNAKTGFYWKGEK